MSAPTTTRGSSRSRTGSSSSATSPDGLVEAVEAPDRAFCLAVLWHPEQNLAGGGHGLYDALVSAARSTAAAA